MHQANSGGPPIRARSSKIPRQGEERQQREMTDEYLMSLRCASAFAIFLKLEGIRAGRFSHALKSGHFGGVGETLSKRPGSSRFDKFLVDISPMHKTSGRSPSPFSVISFIFIIHRT